MANRIFNIEKFQSFWANLPTEARSPGGSEIQLTFAEEGTRMTLTGREGNPIELPWLFGPDEDGTTLLFQVLQQMGVPTGAADEYLTDEAKEALEDSAAQASQTADDTADSTVELDPDTQWAPYEPEDFSASQISVAVLKALALVGGGYIAYPAAQPSR